MSPIARAPGCAGSSGVSVGVGKIVGVGARVGVGEGRDDSDVLLGGVSPQADNKTDNRKIDRLVENFMHSLYFRWYTHTHRGYALACLER